MSQFLSLIPRQALQQQQRLTPQQIQSLHILQLDLLSLESRIEQELEDNPALERGSDDDVVEEPPVVEPSLDPRSDEERPMDVSENDSAPDFERLDTLVREYGWGDDDFEYRGTRSRAALSEEGDIKMEAMANTQSRPVSLEEYLSAQWALVDTDQRTRVIGQAIIDNIAESGRLDTPLSEITSQVQPEASGEEILDALKRVQELEPPGIAGRTLQECLLLQLRVLPGDNELERRIIADHFEDLQRNRLPQIASALDIDMDELKAAIQVIARLAMHPGEKVVERTSPLVVPDIIIEFDDDQNEYTVRLARGNTRELRLSTEFREAIENAKDDKATREFLKQKLDAAKSIIDAVRFRRERLLEVAQSVVKAQRDFFDRGEQHLHILRMSDLAAELGCDPSTISRTVDEKYVQTPRGIFPLRRFFTGGADTSGGEAIGWDSIKAKVQEIVDNEDKSDPLNDDQIVERLKQSGITIKRRTVAKYRQQLDIATARQRREY